MRRAARRLALCLLVLLAACEGQTNTEPTSSPRDTTSSPSARTPSPIPTGVLFQRAPGWMAGYCQTAADDLGYAVLCPRRLPRPLAIIPCSGPPPEEPLWDEHCFDYALDVLFTGTPSYAGPFRGKSRRTGHLAVWTIGPESDFYSRDLLACPGGARRGEQDHLAGRAGSWWTCPDRKSANLNSGHVAFQWLTGDIVYGVSVHGITEVGRQIVRTQIMRLALVAPS